MREWSTDRSFPYCTLVSNRLDGAKGGFERLRNGALRRAKNREVVVAEEEGEG